MVQQKPILLYVSDLYYPAKGRVYYEEDLFITAQLVNEFQVAVCHPQQTAPFEPVADLIVFRNTGPVIHYAQAYAEFRQRLKERHAKVFNDLNGKADMLGKQYLLDLYQADYPVIPTIDRAEQLAHLPHATEYVVKLKNGADSIGMSFVSAEQVAHIPFENVLVQPKIDFEYEVSFYFIGHDFQYAMYAPHPDQRWRMERYTPTADDLAFAQRFIAWNAITHGIQRVDACRTRDGALLLVELEDLNPYLSLLEIDSDTRARFIQRFKEALKALIAS